jgi:hypothetical protein
LPSTDNLTLLSSPQKSFLLDTLLLCIFFFSVFNCSPRSALNVWSRCLVYSQPSRVMPSRSLYAFPWHIRCRIFHLRVFSNPVQCFSRFPIHYNVQGNMAEILLCITHSSFEICCYPVVAATIAEKETNWCREQKTWREL